MPILKRSPSPAKKTIQVAPLVPLRDVVTFPFTENLLSFGRKKSITAVQNAFSKDHLICLVIQKSPNVSEPGPDDFYKVGTICKIERILKTDEETNALVRGLARVKIERVLGNEPYFLVEISEIPEITDKSDEMTALVKHLSSELKSAVNLGKAMNFLVFMKLMSDVSPSELADQTASTLDIDPAEKQKILETADVKKRLSMVIEHLAKEKKILQIERSIASKTQKKFDKSMRKQILRERIKTIKKELGERKEEKEEIKEFRKKIKKAKMPKLAEEKAKKELKRLSKMHAYNPEAGYIRTYLEWLLDIPWGKQTKNSVSIKQAEKVLEKDHYGLKEVKERVLEHLAVMQLKKKEKGRKKKKEYRGSTILCFVGPPGVGKTSIGQSIAKSLGRKFVKISLGGIRDEAEIRGHRRTYVGALPGRIVQGIKDAKAMNPVFMLDEVDKVGADFRGDPSAALLEVLDPEQNYQFADHYLDTPLDLSKVMFITTANVLDTIPPALRDRLEVIRFSGYTEDEKFKIAKKYLIKKALQATALKKTQIKISKDALNLIIKRYTREAGVRNLERQITKIMRKVAKKIAEGKIKKKSVTKRSTSRLLGPMVYPQTLAEEKDEVGMATGLAWTQAGGDVLFVEVALMPGKGQVILTGKLGSVMKESCRAALSFIRSRWKKLNLPKDFWKKNDFHIHVPEGAVPKDGPSAGITIATALYSALSGKKVKRELGMTGEATLRGRVLEVGGIKEKVIAAHRAGLKKVLLPKENKKDLVKVPKHVKKDLEIIYTNSLDKVFDKAIIS